MDACKAFEGAFGLRWNESYELYIVDDELHQSLKTRNPTFKFEIGQLETGGPTVDIEISYAGFDSTYKPDFESAPIRHFPIQRAQNESQLTLGRIFLQEAYVTTNYEHGNFSVSQCRFEEPVGKDIQPILSAEWTPTSNAPPVQTTVGDKIQKKPRLARIQIIGIIVGSLLGLIVLATVFWKLYVLPQRRKRMKASSTTALISSAEDIQRTFSANRPGAAADRKPSSSGPLNDSYQKDAACVPGSDPNSWPNASELPLTDRTELPGQREIIELPLPSPDVNLERPPPDPEIPPPHPRRRFGMYFSTENISSAGTVVRRFVRLHGLRTSQTESLTTQGSSVSTPTQLKNSYLDRPLPPTPISESPQRLSYIAWDRVAVRQHGRLEVRIFALHGEVVDVDVVLPTVIEWEVKRELRSQGSKSCTMGPKSGNGKARD
ncbi:MAG: hypothetical protein Q9186_007354 [Xanthomendoza sp. 1 TL-2023]